MILEATGPGNRPPIKYTWDVDLLAHLILALLIGHQWLIRTWPRAQAKTQVYLLTRFDLLRRRFSLCPVGAVFLTFIIFFLWLHWAYIWSHNAGPFLIEIEKGLSPCLG